MDISRIRLATVDDEAAIVDVFVLAFMADPMWRWAWPNPHTFLSSAPVFARILTRTTIAHGSAYCSDNLVAACLWRRPGERANEEGIGELFQHSLSASILVEFQAVVAQMGAIHPAAAHWYFPLIGVDPAHQGQGYGSALLAHTLQEYDRAH